jgi:hypothetical protein
VAPLRCASIRGVPMALMHFNVKSVSRSNGSNAVARAAYISREKLRDNHLRQTFDYRERGGLEHSEILVPSDARALTRAWAADRANVWNMAEAHERRVDSRVAQEYVVALPHELSGTARLALAKDFAQSLADRYHVVADLAVHQPPPGNDPRNHHAHILTTTREVTDTGLGPKAALAYSDTNRRLLGLPSAREEIRQLRHEWADRVNAQFREARLEITIDARSYWEQGIAQAPQRRLSPAVMALERAGIATDVRANAQREQAALQKLMTDYAQQTTREAERGIAPTVDSPPPRDGRVPTAAAPPTLEEREARAAEQWLAYRKALAEGREPEKGREVTRARDLGAEFEF